MIAKSVKIGINREGRKGAKPIPRWDVHFGGPDDDRKNATAPHITFRPRLGGYRQCGLAICTFHLGFSLIEVDPENWLFRIFGENWGMQMENSQIKGDLLPQRAWLSYRA